VVLLGAAWGAPRARAGSPRPAFEVIVNATNPQTSAPRAFLVDAFLKKVTRWADGELIRPVDLKSGADARRAFSAQVLDRPVTAVRSYWQERIFSGRDVPPPELDTDAAVVQFVAKYPGAVGYVSSRVDLSDAKDGVKVLRVE